MIERTTPVNPRLRAGAQTQPQPEPTRNWMHDRAPRFRSLVRERQRREQVWAWLSLITLIVCWDASSRLGERVSPPRSRLASLGHVDGAAKWVNEHPEPMDKLADAINGYHARFSRSK